MNSENNLLPPFVIASLYKDDLVLVDAKETRSNQSMKAETKKSEVHRAAIPTLFFLKRRQANSRGLLLVSTPASEAPFAVSASLFI